jgi:hypothetical protein
LKFVDGNSDREEMPVWNFQNSKLPIAFLAISSINGIHSSVNVTNLFTVLGGSDWVWEQAKYFETRIPSSNRTSGVARFSGKSDQ